MSDIKHQLNLAIIALGDPTERKRALKRIEEYRDILQKRSLWERFLKENGMEECIET